MASKNTPQLTIRQFRESDRGQVWALAALSTGGDAGPEPPLPLQVVDEPPAAYPDLANIISTFVLSGGDFIVAERGAAIVGTAGLLPSEQRSADVVRVRVHPAVRRRGIGTALLEAIERRAIELGIRRLNLDMEGNPGGAVEFYLASGFQKLDPDNEDSGHRWAISLSSKALRSLP